ncbi:MAG TPA: ATP-binding protein [Gaiellales bacterium]|jgi:anti-sigma regulatory factor (Ser/Thr protein kinase)|nr:ATP-binding protein [Gaiellales bacterium]
MATTSGGFELEIAATAPSVPLVRHALRGLLATFDVPEEQVADISLAVTEACTNAVVHAYSESSGQIEVTAARDAGTLAVTVRDHGAGMAPRMRTHGLGVGLPVIAAIAESVEIGTPEGGGTEVRMRFALAGQDG